MKVSMNASLFSLFLLGSSGDAFVVPRSTGVATSLTSTRVVEAPPSVGQASPFGVAPAGPLAMPRERGGVLTPQRRAVRAPDRREAKRPASPFAPQKVQGGSLSTWSIKGSAVERVEINLVTQGRPLDADIDLWNGPDNTPNKMRVYVEDGRKRPVRAVLETPRTAHTVAVRNIGQLEFPLEAQVVTNPSENAYTTRVEAYDRPKTIQGGALKTYGFGPEVRCVELMLRSDGRPMNARIELLQGPDNVKQVMELYIEDGLDRPFYTTIETPGSGNVVRIVNTSTMEFPITASVGPREISEFQDDYDGPDIVVSGTGDVKSTFEGW